MLCDSNKDTLHKIISPPFSNVVMNESPFQNTQATFIVAVLGTSICLHFSVKLKLVQRWHHLFNGSEPRGVFCQKIRENCLRILD